MKLMHDTGEDLSVREIARRLDRPYGHVFYHLKRLYERGVLTREQIEDKVYYTPQALFTEEIDDVLDTLMDLSKLITEPDDKKISNCIAMFLQCYDSVGC